MTVSVFLSALVSAMADALGQDFKVCAADDDFSALDIIGGSAPDTARVVITCGDLTAVEGAGAGMVCQLSTRMVVQVRRGMGIDATDEARHSLLNAEEAVRRYALSLLFCQEGITPPTWQEIAAGKTPHPHVGQLVHGGSVKFESNFEELVLEHPAREIRFTNLIALESPSAGIPVPLPL